MENTTHENSVEQLKEKIKDVRVCGMATVGHDHKMQSRPMSTVKVEDDGSLWFFSRRNTEKTEEIKEDQEIMLTYLNPNDNTYVVVNGTARIVEDEARKKEYFNPFVKAYFPEGPEDQNLILIKVNPIDAEYWDGSGSKIVNAFKILTSAITGKKPDMGEHGKIDL